MSSRATTRKLVEAAPVVHLSLDTGGEVVKLRAAHASPIARLVALAVALLVAGAHVADGQSAVYGAGLQAWLGCWSVEPWVTRDESAPPIVCIAPTADRNVAEVLTVRDDAVVSRDTMDASGRSRPLRADRCTGTHSASWSRDGRRLFVRSSGRCADLPSSTSGIMTISADGDWLDVEGISARGVTSVRVARYRAVAAPDALPASMRSALRAQSLATRSIRRTSASPVRAEDVLEASRAVDSAVVEAWILERAQRFEIAAHEVGALLTSGVSPRIADALAAVADPQSYALVRGDDERAGTTASGVYYDSFGLPFGWGWSYFLPIGSRHGRGGRDGWRYGHYRPPVLVIRGLDGRPRRTERGNATRPGDERYGGDGRGRTARPRDDGAPSGDPRRPAAGESPRPAPSSGGTVRLGKPRG
jgi:hypothetical protein